MLLLVSRFRTSGVGTLEMLILEGTAPPKGNAQAARCTGGVNVNGWDRISLHQNLENLS